MKKRGAKMLSQIDLVEIFATRDQVVAWFENTAGEIRLFVLIAIAISE